MSSISSLMNASAADAVSKSKKTGGGGFAEMASEDFVKILMTELTNQDPLEPNDSQAILNQLSSLRNIESQTQLQDKLESLVLQNELSQAGGMIGKKIEALDEESDKIEGIVTAVRVVDGKAELELDTGKTVAMDRVTRITEKSPAAPTPPTIPTTPTTNDASLVASDAAEELASTLVG